MITDPRPSSNANRTRNPIVFTAPSSLAARVRGRAARALFRRVAATLPIRVQYGHGPSRADSTDLPTMQIWHPEALFRRVGTEGLIGLGESYMAEEWAADDLVGVLVPFAERIATVVPPRLQRLRPWVLPSHPKDEENTVDNTQSNISRHYDLSNDLFRLFLDETLTYSSAYFGDNCDLSRVDHDQLADAQRVKIDRLLDQAGVHRGSRVLEIGTGWGELALRAAGRGAQVRSITLSAEQQVAARRRAEEAGLADLITVDLLDYRNVDGEYDAVVSVEMIEAVGIDYLPDYFATIRRVLNPGGRAAIQCITMPHDRMLASANTYTWVHKYIFPGGQLPSADILRSTASDAGLQVTGAKSFGLHYARTLELWREAFTANADAVTALGFDAVFQRMWVFYLAYSQAGFTSGYLDVMHLQLTNEEKAK